VLGKGSGLYGPLIGGSQGNCSDVLTRFYFSLLFFQFFGFESSEKISKKIDFFFLIFTKNILFQKKNVAAMRKFTTKKVLIWDP
jgi:hypothetical protein